MQINKPPSSTSSSGVPTGGSGSTDKTSRAENPLAQLVGQIVNAQVLQSKAVQIATTQTALLQAGIAARLTSDQREQKPPATAQTTSNTSNTSNATPSSTTPATATPSSTPSTQTQYQTTLQIGNQRIVVLSEQPLQPGAQLMLKVSSPQAIQLLQQPAAIPSTPAADLADKLLNSMLRQALPLQQPVAKLLATLANDLLLFNKGNTNSPLVPQGIALPTGLAPTVAIALKPLLTQILNAQLTVDNVTEPDVLRTAVTNSGLFREARLVQWAQALLQQFPAMMTQSAPLSATTFSALATSVTPGSALAQAVASVLTPQSALTSTTPNPSASTAGPLPAILTSAAPLPSGVIAGATRSPATAGNTIDADEGASGTDVDILRNELLKALSDRAQKNQSAFTSQTAASPTAAHQTVTPPTTGAHTAVTPPASAQTANAAVAATLGADNAKTVAGATTASASGNGIPVNAKTATSALPIDTSVTADTKTTLEKLVSVTSQQLLERSGHATDAIDEEQALVILRQLTTTQELHSATTRSKPQKDDDQWLLQLLRSSFGALKHLQLQQATNLNAAPSAQHAGMDSPVAPLQIELPIQVAQQWHSVNIEIDRRAPENRPEGNPNERSWRVTLRFELPQLGIIVTQLSLSGVHVNATLWAEKQTTCGQLQQQLTALSDRLGKVGAHVTTLDVRHGQPPSSKTRIEQRLIDIRT